MSSRPSLTPGLLGFLAVASGLTVANIYYNQPLLAVMARDFQVSSAAIGWVAVATQLGYASGLLLLVPLGDIFDRKRLIIASAYGTTLVLLAVAFASNLAFAVSTSFLLGLICITPQFIVPYTAHLADAKKRGAAVGLVMSGLILGILVSRSAAGFLGEWIGWRGVFGCGAGLTLLTALCLGRLPHSPRESHTISYGQVLRSLLTIFLREPVLRRHAISGALAFGAFSAFWTTLVFYLGARPEHYGGTMVGLFGLIAIGGVLTAPVAGRLSDRFSVRIVNGISLVAIVLSFLVMLLADRSLAWLAAGVFFMDAGAQANQISNQTRIYALAPEFRNRITSVYMFVYFLGGALGSALASRAWAEWKWTGVCLLGASFAALALVALFAGRAAETQRHAPNPAAARARPTAAPAPLTTD